MTIGKKLYAGFGLILATLSVLFVVNIIAGWRESSARKDASVAFDSKSTVESVRYQIMLNRLYMNNFLLSGDPRDQRLGKVVVSSGFRTLNLDDVSADCVL